MRIEGLVNMLLLNENSPAALGVVCMRAHTELLSVPTTPLINPTCWHLITMVKTMILMQ